MEEFREIEFEGVLLRVYRNGEICRWINKHGRQKIHNPFWRKTGILNMEYLKINLNKKMYLIHRIIAMVYLDLDISDTTKQVDHIDRCTTNNNVNNLRVVQHQKNMWNTTCKGYYWNKVDKKWRVQIMINNKSIYLGLFNIEEEAKDAYLKAKEIYHKID
jgi:hypothetical protein